ncbi:unnamed protein product, partial [Closterium sp. NIES-53]
VLGLPPPSSPPPLLSPPPIQSQSQLQPASLLHGPSPYSGPARGLTERREPESRPVSPESRFASPVCTVGAGRCVSRPRPPPIPGTHSMTLRPSTAPQRVPLPSPPASSLPDGPDPESDYLSYCHAQEEFDCFAVAVPHLVSMLLAPEGDLDAPDIPTPHSYAEAIEGPYSSQWQAAMDAEMASWKSTSTYVDEFPPPRANIVSGMWIFRVKRPSDSPPVFKARYVARGFNQRQGVDFFQTFSPTPKMTTLWVLLHVAAQRDYELHSLDFSTAFLQGSLHEEIWLRRPPGFTGSFPAGTQWSLRRPVLQRFGLTYSSPQSTPLLTGHSLSAPPSDESVEPSGPYPELVGCLITTGMGLVLRGRARVVLTGHADASWVDDLATQRSSHGYTFSLGSGSVSWQSTRSSSVLSSNCEAEIYAGAMAALELL